MEEVNDIAVEHELQTAAPKKSKDETIEIAKKDLDVLLDRITKLESRGKPTRAKVVNEDTVMVAFWDEKAVVGFGKFSNVRNDMGEVDLMLEIKLQDSKGKVTTTNVKYTEFIVEAARKIARITKKDTEEIVQEIRDPRTGETMEVERTQVDGYKSKKLGFSVPMTVETHHSKFYVTTDDGESFILDENVVNI